MSIILIIPISASFEYAAFGINAILPDIHETKYKSIAVINV